MYFILKFNNIMHIILKDLAIFFSFFIVIFLLDKTVSSLRVRTVSVFALSFHLHPLGKYVVLLKIINSISLSHLIV